MSNTEVVLYIGAVYKLLLSKPSPSDVLRCLELLDVISIPVMAHLKLGSAVKLSAGDGLLLEELLESSLNIPVFSLSMNIYRFL